jgi:hypothetical protein
MGDGIELEFVDDSFTGKYRLAVGTEEKDALLNVGNLGPTLAETMGLAEKADRPYFSGDYSAESRYPFMYRRAKDDPFVRYETVAKVRSAKPVKYRDLKEIVDVEISYSSLPFKAHQDYFKLNEDQVLVPITIQVDNKDLSFDSEKKIYQAKVAVYGIVTSITNRIISEFEDEMTASYPPQDYEAGLEEQSIYQKVVLLDKKMRYRLDLVVKDLNSGNVGVVRKAIVPPSYVEGKLVASSMILSDSVHQLDELPREDQMFVLGDILIHPRIDKTFTRENVLGIYFQIYHAALDQTSLAPSLRATYRILRNEEAVLEAVDETGKSLQFFSGQRVVLIARIPLEGFEAGAYRIQVEIEDSINKQSVALEDEFRLRDR